MRVTIFMFYGLGFSILSLKSMVYYLMFGFWYFRVFFLGLGFQLYGLGLGQWLMFWLWLGLRLRLWFCVFICFWV